jgi:hypothetical protein
MTIAQKVSSSRTSRCSGLSGDTAAPASNTAATITLPAVAGQINVISGLTWSFSSNPSSGILLTLSDNGTVIRQWYVTNGGPGPFHFDPPLANAAVNTALVATLAAAGSGISGTVNWEGAWLETP